MASDDVRALAAKLLKLAEQATPGSWTTDECVSRHHEWAEASIETTYVDDRGHPAKVAEADTVHEARYIAAASPDAVTALARAVLAQETRPTCATCQWWHMSSRTCEHTEYIGCSANADHFCGFHEPAPPDQPREEEA